MEETVERITERHAGKAVPVKHLWRRQYQISGEDWHDLLRSFTDWKGERRKRGFRFSMRVGGFPTPTRSNQTRGWHHGAQAGTPIHVQKPRLQIAYHQGRESGRQDGFRRHMANEQLSCLGP